MLDVGKQKPVKNRLLSPPYLLHESVILGVTPYRTLQCSCVQFVCELLVPSGLTILTAKI
jgi:hypothetical protein